MGDADLTDVKKRLTGNQILIQTIHNLHITILDHEFSDLRIFDDTLLLHTLRQWHIAVLQTPAY